MKTPTSFGKIAMILIFLFISTFVRSQDTLHLDFGNTQVVPDKAMEDKIVAWGKTLNGKKQDLSIVAYYHKADFKKFAEQRVEEMFLSVNRKVRDLVNIKSQDTKKGENYQRTRVDLIYYPEGQDAKSVAKKKADEEKAAKEAEKKKKDEEAAAKAKDSKDKKGGTTTASTGDKNADKKAAELAKKEEEARKKERFDKYGVRPTKAAGQGDFVKEKEVQQIKKCKLIVAEFGFPKQDEEMMTAVKNFWSFSSNVVSMPYKLAKEEAKKDPDNVFIFFVTSANSKSLTHNNGAFNTSYQTVSSGAFMVIENAKGGVMANSYIPTYGGELTPEILAFGVSVINHMLKVMDEKQMGSNLKLEGAYKEHSAELKNKTLYIPEGWVHEKLDKNEAKNDYTGNFEFVSYEKWRDAILNKEDVAYVILAPKPVGGKFVYQHFLMDAKTGMVYAIHSNNAASFNTGIAGDINLNKSNTGYINNKNIRKYNDALKGDW